MLGRQKAIHTIAIMFSLAASAFTQKGSGDWLVQPVTEPVDRGAECRW